MGAGPFQSCRKNDFSTASVYQALLCTRSTEHSSDQKPGLGPAFEVLRYLNGVEMRLTESCVLRISSQDKNWNKSYARFHLKIL